MITRTSVGVSSIVLTRNNANCLAPDFGGRPSLDNGALVLRSTSSERATGCLTTLTHSCCVFAVVVVVVVALSTTSFTRTVVLIELARVFALLVTVIGRWMRSSSVTSRGSEVST